MVVGELPEAVDLLVVGGGPGGYVAALRAAELGREVVLVERHGPTGGLGGTCLHVGCIPSKALIELAEAVAGVERLRARGLRVDAASADLGAFQRDKSEIVTRLAAQVSGLLQRRGVRVVEGIARLAGPRRAVVERAGTTALFLEFRDVILATGSRPRELPELPLDGARVIDSTGALALAAVPRAVAVVGGGYVGLELACALHGLGAEVTVVEYAERLLPGMDAPAAAVVQRALVRRGLRVLCGAVAEGDRDDQLDVRIGDEHERLAVDVIVVAAGRVPNSDDLGLSAVGLQPSPDGTIPVGEDRLAAAAVAAVGDLTPGPALAHKAMAEGVVAAESLCGLPAAFDPACIPAVVYTDPELAVVGETEASARALGVDVMSASVPFSALGRAATLAAPDGYARVVAERDSGVLLGVQLVGRHVSELIAEATLAIEMGATLQDLAYTIHPHPTLSEAISEAAQAGIGAPAHALG